MKGIIIHDIPELAVRQKTTPITRTLIVMGILSTILNLFGYSGQTKNDDITQNTDIANQITESIEAFKNRPIHDELTNEIIDSTSDDELLQVVFDNLTTKLPDNYEKEYKTVMTWNKSKQAIYLIWLLEAEVNNGGYINSIIIQVDSFTMNYQQY